MSNKIRDYLMPVSLERITVKRETSMREVLQRMVENNLAVVIVVDDAQEHVGIITGTDILTEILREAKSTLLLEGTAELAMTKPLAPVAQDKAILDILGSMLRPVLHSLVVQEDEVNKKVVGIFAQVDVLRWWLETFSP